MIIAFETPKSKILDDFLDRYENPESVTAQLSKNSFIEFKIHRFGNLVILSQKHLFDVVAVWLLMCAVVNMIFAYVYGHELLFFIGGVFTLVGILWLSKYMRFYALKLKMWRLGHKDKVSYVENPLVIEKLLMVIDKK